jgi:hypothetical protein
MGSGWVERRTDGDALYLGVGVLNREIVEGEHAMEGFSKELDLEASVGEQRELQGVYVPLCTR